MSLSWKSKAVQSLWKTIFPFLIKLNVYLPCNPGTLLLDKYEKWKHMSIESLVHDSYTANLFTTTKNWKLSKNHQQVLNLKLRYIHTLLIPSN